MSELNQNAFTLLSTVTQVSMTVNSNPLLYTPPSGKSAVITHLVLRNASVALNAATNVNFGNNASFNNWNKGAGGSTAVSLAAWTTAAGYCMIVYPTAPQDTARRDTCVITESLPFYMLVSSTGVTGATMTVDIFGYLF